MSVRARFLPRELPDELDALADLALDLRWTWSHEGDALFRRLDEETWSRTQNAWLVLESASRERLLELARDASFRGELAKLVERRERYLLAPGWYGEARARADVGSVAYFSMEFGLGEGLPLYAGGLGILAGDHLKTASDLGVPLVGVGLLFQEGYFRQTLDPSGRQRETYPFNEPTTLPIQPVASRTGTWLRIALELPGRTLRLRAWEARVGRTQLYLLDTNDPLNAPMDRGITARLYDAEPETRLLQEVVLGIGGVRLLEALGPLPEVFHLNEGHAAFAALERALAHAERERVPLDEALLATRGGNVFTTHTAVAAGFDAFAVPLVERTLRARCERAGVELASVVALGRRSDLGPFRMADLAMRTCSAANGVSRLHGEVSRALFSELFPRRPIAEVPVGHVTNGVHPPSWDSPAADALWTDSCGKERWLGGVEGSVANLECASDEQLWELRRANRAVLVVEARRRAAEQSSQRGATTDEVAAARHVLDPNVLTLGFARRFAEYKRPTLLLRDPERLARMLLDPHRPVQIVVAGKAHPRDDDGKRALEAWVRFAARPEVRHRVVFLEDYDMALAQLLVQGVDLWLNVPRRPYEACGTSGMKVLVNGGLNLSTLDGWWAEAYSPEVGWAIGGGREGDGRDGAGRANDERDANELVALLEDSVVPDFYARDELGVPRRWIARVRTSLERLTARFSSNRMLREYVETVYAPAARRARERASPEVARELARWSASLDAGWPTLHVGETRWQRDGGAFSVEVPIQLGDLAPADVRVELYAEPRGGEPSAIVLERDGALAGTEGGNRYRATLVTDRPPSDFTVRVVPHHPLACVPFEQTRIEWAR